jgi:hypothetical protein
MNLSRRKFAQALAMSTVAAPLVADAFAQANSAPTTEAEMVDLDMRMINVKRSDKRGESIQEAVELAVHQAEVIRAYPLKRDTQPALILAVFNS